MNTRVWAAALPAMLLAMSAAHAGEPASTGMKVGVDAATGKLRALTEEESAALDTTTVGAHGLTTKRLLLSDSQAAPQRRQSPTGVFAMQVPESEMTHLEATRDASGKVVVRETGAGADADAALPQEATK